MVQRGLDSNVKNIFISDFMDTRFQEAFKIYFGELGIQVKDWDGLFQEIDSDKETFAYVRLSEENKIIGFIMFRLIHLTNWFFEEKLGFIREFWIAEKYRNGGHGSELISLAEKYFTDNDTFKSILTTDTAEKFYLDRGYRKDMNYKAKNEDLVYVKEL